MQRGDLFILSGSYSPIDSILFLYSPPGLPECDFHYHDDFCRPFSATHIRRVAWCYNEAAQQLAHPRL
jgi:hypothetical protein